MITRGYSKQNALFFARLSEDCYLEPHAFKLKWAISYDVEFIEGPKHGSEAYALVDGHDLIFVFRGTEPNKWQDIKADIKFRRTDADCCQGSVHRGFKDYLDRIWDQVEKIYNDYPDHHVWITGHSLGAAMATLAASRFHEMKFDHGLHRTMVKQTKSCQVYNYGSPRVGDEEFAKHFQVPLYRHRNNNDIVTRHPIEFVGFRHVGFLKFFGGDGGFNESVSRWTLVREWFTGNIKGLFQWPPTIDSFADHSMSNYVELCQKRVEENHNQ